MTDEKFEELKRKVAEEELRRREIKQVQEEVDFYKKGLGLQQPNGWCNTMIIKIIQDVDMLQGQDGNGGIKHRHYEVELEENECKLLFKAFEEMSKIYEKWLKEYKK